jgi:hypothetical protein
MRATTEREAFLQDDEPHWSRQYSALCLTFFERFAGKGFCSGFLAANRAAGAKRKVGTVVRSCRYDLASDQPGGH